MIKDLNYYISDFKDSIVKSTRAYNLIDIIPHTDSGIISYKIEDVQFDRFSEDKITKQINYTHTNNGKTSVKWKIPYYIVQETNDQLKIEFVYDKNWNKIVDQTTSQKQWELFKKHSKRCF